jgi:hypothetical protein
VDLRLSHRCIHDLPLDSLKPALTWRWMTAETHSPPACLCQWRVGEDHQRRDERVRGVPQCAELPGPARPLPAESKCLLERIAQQGSEKKPIRHWTARVLYLSAMVSHATVSVFSKAGLCVDTSKRGFACQRRPPTLQSSHVDPQLVSRCAEVMKKMV